MKTNEKIEKTAELVHHMWSEWAKEIVKKELNLSEDRVNRWKTECFKPYSELSEEMKDLDRNFAKRFIELLG